MPENKTVKTDEQRKKKKYKLLKDIGIPIIAALLSALVSVIGTHAFDKNNVQSMTIYYNGEETTVLALMEKCSEYLKDITELKVDNDAKAAEINRLENDLEDSDAKDDEIIKLNKDIAEKDKSIAELTEKLKQLENKASAEIVHEMTTTRPVLLRDIDFLKNEGVQTDQAGIDAVNGEHFSHYIAGSREGTCYIEFALNGQYETFKANAFVTQAAYERFDENNPSISNASITVEVKYSDDSKYQQITSISGLSRDKKSVPIEESVYGAVKMRIVFTGAVLTRAVGPNMVIAGLGEPVLYLIENE